MSNAKALLTPASTGSEAVGHKAKAIVAAINEAGNRSSDADRAAKALTVDNLSSFFSIVFCSVTGVALKVMDCMELMSGMSPEFSAAKQNEIYDAFKGFIEVHGEFIATVAGKHDLVANWPCCMLIASCLLAAKMCIDTFAIRVSELMPTRADDAKPQQESLDRSLQHAVDLFGP